MTNTAPRVMALPEKPTFEILQVLGKITDYETSADAWTAILAALEPQEAEPAELWALCYLHDWDPPKEGQEHRWEPGKNVFPAVHAFYHSGREAEAIRATMSEPDKYWVVRARPESAARLAAAPAQPEPAAWVQLRAWLMAQRLALQTNDPDFMPKHETLKSVGAKMRELVAPVPASELEPQEAEPVAYQTLTDGKWVECSEFVAKGWSNEVSEGCRPLYAVPVPASEKAAGALQTAKERFDQIDCAGWGGQTIQSKNDCFDHMKALASQGSMEVSEALSALSHPVQGWQTPEGFALVPVEPLPEMLGAWYRYKSGYHFPNETPPPDTSDYGAYRAMIAAAPLPAGPSSKETAVETHRLSEDGPCPYRKGDVLVCDRDMNFHYVGEVVVVAGTDKRYAGDAEPFWVCLTGKPGHYDWQSFRKATADEIAKALATKEDARHG